MVSPCHHTPFFVSLVFPEEVLERKMLIFIATLPVVQWYCLCSWLFEVAGLTSAHSCFFPSLIHKSDRKMDKSSAMLVN
jgi:hypothetical protein